MRLLSILSFALVLLSSEATARPSHSKRNATLSAMIAKRQTNRHEINLRSHVKDVVKRVTKQNAADRESAVKRAARAAPATPATPVHKEVERVHLAPRQVTSQDLRKRALPARERVEATRAYLAPRQVTSQDLRKRALPARNQNPTRVELAPRQNPSADLRKRSLPGKQRSADIIIPNEERSTYPKCKKGSSRTGYAHYPGWKLVGDELSGALPITAESACIQACNKYGGACSGVHFDSEHGRCFLKGTKTSGWDFSEGLDADGVDLVGGCALWANIVPEEMDAICCRD